MKAYCITWVVFCHVFPYLQEIGYPIFGGVQVPIFFLIQAFHFYKKVDSSFKIENLCKRIILPFFILELIIAPIYLSINKDASIISIFANGGCGPGSYYPWCFVQFAILLPLFSPLLKSKLKESRKALIFLAISIVAEWGASELLPGTAYRLCAARYIFLVYLGYVWATFGVMINNKTILLSIFSVLVIVVFAYSDMNFTKVIDQHGWHSHVWPCYFWPAFLYIFLLYPCSLFIQRTKYLEILIRNLSRSSYEVFLTQMAILTIFRAENLSFLPFDKTVIYIIWMSTAFVASIFVGISWRLFLDRKIKNK